MDNMNTAGPQQRPNDDEWNSRAVTDSRKNHSPATMILLVVALFIALGDGFYSYHLGQQAAEMRNNIQSAISSQGETIQKLSQQLAETGDHFTSLMQDVSSTKDHLGSTQGELKKTRQMAAALAKQQKESSEQLTGQLGQLQQEQSTTQGTVGTLSSDVTGVKSDVSGVKQDVNTTKEQLAATRNDLQRVVGDLGVQSDLVAHNGQELAELKLRGERNYVEFDVRKSSQPQRVGNIAIALKKTDMKRQKFTINLVVDDRTIEKKDKTVNEPVQFYQDGYRQPTEIVANHIYKDRIVGYVSVPKKKEPRITASAAQPAGAGF